MGQQDFSERMKEVIDRLGGLTSAAEKTGISRSLLDRYRNGKSEPGRDKLIVLSKAAAVDLGWLAIGQPSDMESSDHEISLYSPNLSPAGELTALDTFRISNRLLPLTHDIYADVDVAELYAFQLALPDSLHILNQRPVCVVERMNSFGEDGPYAVSLNGNIVIRHVVRHQDGVQLRSDLGKIDEYGYEELASDTKQIAFLGRIIWAGGPL